MTPDEFGAMTRAAASSVGRLTADGVREARRILEEMRNAALVQLAGTPTEYNEWYFSELLGSVGRAFDDLEARYTSTLERTLDQAAEQVTEAIDAPLERAGILIDLPVASRQVVEMLTGFSPGALVGGLAADGKALVQSVLREGLLGVKSPWEVQQAIAGTLEAAGPFGSILSRAEAIWQTEANRVFNVLAQERYRRIEQWHPGRFGKVWMHSGNTRHPRLHHVKLEEATTRFPLRLDEKFLVGSYAVDGPHDPDLPAGETIRCGCGTRMVMRGN